MKRLFLLISAIALLAASCQREVPIGKDREVEIRIVTGTSIGGGGTRAVTGTNPVEGSALESKIFDVAVLVFDNTDTPDNHDDAKFVRSTYAWRKSDGLWSAILETGEKLDVYFAINAQEFVDAAIELSTPGDTYAQVKDRLVILDSDVLLNDLTNNGLPMWGYHYNETITASASNSFGTVKVLRAMAAAEFTVSASNFDLASTAVWNRSDRGLLPYPASKIKFDDDGDNEDAPQKDYWLSAPELPTGVLSTGHYAISNEPPVITTEGGQTLQRVFDTHYFLENDTNATAEKTYTKAIIGGIYENDTEKSYYPLAFRDPTATAGNNQRVPIIRNTKYIFKISKVNGRGFPTIEEAAAAEDQNIEYEVIKWNQWDQGDIVTWGTYWLSVGMSRNERAKGTAGVTKTASLYRNASSHDEIAFSTNLPFGSDMLQLEGVVANQPLKYTAAATAMLKTGESIVANAAVANANFEIYLIEGETTVTGGKAQTAGRLLFFALKDYSTDVTNALTVKYEDLEYYIKVRQTNSSPEDWIPEEDQEWEAGSKA